MIKVFLLQVISIPLTFIFLVLCVCMCTICVPSSRGGERTESSALQLQVAIGWPSGECWQ